MVSFHQTITDRCANHPTHTSKNPLIVPAPIGKTPAASINLPPNDFIYGKHRGSDEYGAKDCFDWQISKPSHSTKNEVPDFQRINRECVARRCYHPKGYAAARNNGGVNMTLADTKARDKFVIELNRNAEQPKKDEVYGIKSGSYSPMNKIIQHEYHKEAAEEANAVYAYYNYVRESEASPLKIKMTKATVGHGTAAWSQTTHKQPFKLSKFGKCQKKVNTFR